MDLPIPRAHAFEFNDAPWAPAPLRDLIVETLSRTLDWGHVLRGLVGPFSDFLAASGASEVLDLCAGAGGPARILSRELARAGCEVPRFYLSDLHPQPHAWQAARSALPGSIDYVAEPIDATRIPPELSKGRARTIINALHHFRPPLAQAMLADAVAGGVGIFVVEAFARNPLGFLPLAPVGLPALALAPLLADRDRLAKALFTWLTPISALSGAWDGFISTLRIHSEAELRRLIAPIGGGFTWRFGTYAFPFGGRGTWFYGVPEGGRRRSAAAAATRAKPPRGARRRSSG